MALLEIISGIALCLQDNPLPLMLPRNNFQNPRPSNIFLMAVLAADGIFSPPFRYRRYRYAIDEECIDIQEGYLWLEEHIVPMERLHQITMAQGPIDRIFGLTKVIVTTAGGEVTIRFLEYEKAQLISESLKKKINQIAMEERNEPLPQESSPTAMARQPK